MTVSPKLTLQDDEKEFFLLLARMFEDKPRESIHHTQISDALEITPKRVDAILNRFINRGFFDNCGGYFSATQKTIDLAREIQHLKEQAPKSPDHVDQLVSWAKSKPVIAFLIVAAQVLGPIIGLVGGVLGILAFWRT